MKTIEFFKNKAESFLKQLNEIQIVEFKFSISKDIYQQKISGDNTEYYAQSELLKSIKFQTNLMFSEFDNSELFIEKLNDFSPENILGNSENLEHLKNINQLFLGYLKEYRE